MTNKTLQTRIDQIDAQLANLREQYATMKSNYESEKSLMDSVTDLKNQIAQLTHEAELATQSWDYNRSAEISYGRIPALQQQLTDIEAQIETAKANWTLVSHDTVDAEDIAHVIAKRTGIPASKLVQSDKDKLIHIEDELRKSVVWQDQAITAVSNAIRRSRAGIGDQARPIGSFIFAGPTGVGKTQLAKALAGYLFNDESAMIRIDMSEYMEKHAVSRLIGSPPGYIGHDEWGQLTEAVRRKPYSIILFDEIEKAHPDVFNTLLQVLDDGRLTDSKGRTVNFRNSIIIMTTNIGSQLIQDKFASDYDKGIDTVRANLEKELIWLISSHFRPEFVNRVDDVIVFNPLSKNLNREIVKGQLQQLITQVKSDKNIILTIEDSVIDYLISVGFDPAFGARPLKRAIQRYVMDPLATAMIRGDVTDGSHITVDMKDAKVIIH